MSNYHIPVLLQEAVEALQVRKDTWYVDATAGGGGHVREILRQGGNVIAIDQDKDAIEVLSAQFAKDKRVIIVHSNFNNIAEICRDVGKDKVAGVLFDLGVSSHQLDTSGRGFSLRFDEPLDMRMGTSDKTAAIVVNEYPPEQLTEIFERYGEEVNAKKISEALVKWRAEEEVRTTKDLVDIIESLHLPAGDIHPATRVFQALRIEVNNELDVFHEALENTIDIVEKNGRIVVISFHSLEDRIVKRIFQGWQREKRGQIITKKPILATDDEIRRNRRSRSAKLRYFEKS